jgi:mannose/fructose/N-acetylgalactosamine-specific phosphotransferase system component IIB
MANLGMKKYEQVGDFMLKLCKDRKRCNELAKDPALATKAFKEVLKSDMPAGHKIVVHLDEENVTHVIIPQKKDIEDIEALIKKGITVENRVYPLEYQMNPLLKISETKDPPRAFAFLLGEYTLRRCKN